MRATQSAGLFCQIVGRGLRVHESKSDCLIVDFGNNLRRHGPIDSVDFGTSKPKSERTGDAPQKTCYGCGEAVAAGLRQCECGFLFTFSETKHETKADEESQILSEPETFAVTGWQLSRHFKKGNETAPNTLRVTYFVSGNMESAIEEWVCLNHEGFALNKALRWWSEHSDENLVDVAEALETDLVGAAIDIWQRGWVRRPVELTAIQQGRFWRITGRVAGQLDKDLEEEEIPF
jgi:DNA repair protein RadD